LVICSAAVGVGVAAVELAAARTIARVTASSRRTSAA
jgi:hypothetical protein